MFTLLSILFLHWSNPLPPDTIQDTDSTIVHIVQINPLTRTKGEPATLDQFHNTVHRYNPASLHFNWYGTTGNTGMPAVPLYYIPDSIDYQRHGFTAQHIYAGIAFPSYSFKRRKPYTELYYVMGVAKEQMLDILHYQPGGKRFDTDLRFRIIHAPGSYLNQRSYLPAISLRSRYQSLDQRYEASITFRHYKFDNRENGGIANDSIYLANSESDRKVIPVHLQQAYSLLRNTGWTLQQTYTLLPPEQQAPWVLPRLVTMVNELDRSYRVYADQDLNLNYYPAILLDSSRTYDSIHYSHLSQRLIISNKSSDHPSYHYEAGAVLHEASYFDGKDISRQKGFQTIFKLFARPWPKLQLQFRQNNIHWDKEGQEAETHILLKLDPLDNIGLQVGLSRLTKLPDHFQTSFHGNHLAWENDFSPSRVVSSWASIRFHSWELRSIYSRQTGTRYYDMYGYPRQFQQAIHHLNTELHGRHEIGKFNTELKVRHHSSDRPSILRFPTLLGSGMVYFHDILFDSALRLQAGIELTWMNAWYGLNYYPNTAQYILQNRKETGGKGAADVFLNLHLKKASVFIKYRDITSMLMDESFFLLADYPQTRPGLMFGVKWRFLD